MNNLKIKKAAKFLVLTAAIVIVIVMLVFAFYCVKISVEYGNVNFDKDKLLLATSYAEIVDNNDNAIGKTSVNGRTTTNLATVPKHTLEAFLAIEDKDFYSHSGLNYRRIAKSLLTNIKHGYAKEGASTISQQLIKNTHLSNDKTIERKLKEVFLTKKLEKTFTKDEILEIYLNVIYFGNSCFGLEDASSFYFNKTANSLTIAESATLAGLIKSPKLYNPLTNKENCLNRRNLVINQMQKYGFITSAEAQSALSEKLEISQNRKQDCVEKAALDSACTLLNMSEKDVINSQLKISTFIDPKLQKLVDDIDLDMLKIGNVMPNYAIIIENNNDGTIQALRYSNVDILNMKRQPASCLKPFLVYAPNIEDGKINLMTKVDDSPINYGSFSPANADKKYKGYISAKEALSTSSNVCATKLLNYYGIDKAKATAAKFGFNFEKEDNHLALALGSMYHGCDLITLTNAYATLSRGGNYIKPQLIKTIKSKQLPLYASKAAQRQAISPETAYQLTLALQDCSANGTGKKLVKFCKYVACKTGTNGVTNSSSNTDAYNVSYSKEYTVCVWIGATDETLLPSNFNGGNHASIIAKSVWEQLAPQNKFEKPQNIIEKTIDKITYDSSGQIKLADDNAPERYTFDMFFNKKYAPKEKSTLFSDLEHVELDAKYSGNAVKLNFECKKYYNYTLFKSTGDNLEVLQTIDGKNGEIVFTDTNLPTRGAVSYYVVVSTNRSNTSRTSNIAKIIV